MNQFFSCFIKIFLFPIVKIFIKEIKGKENLFKYNNFILAANHTNSLDQFLIAFMLKKRLKDVHFIGAINNFKILVLSGLLYKLSDTIVINRKNTSREEFLEKVVKYLKEGKIIVIYPEGDTNKNSFLLEGKTGVAELSLKSGIPVIPVGIAKAEKSFKKNIKIGKPLDFSAKINTLPNPEKNQKEYRLALREITDEIMKNISDLCGKPYQYDNTN